MTINNSIKEHTIEPVYNKDSKILILGSFPSVKSREMNFYYGHPQNRFWIVLAKIFDEDVPISIGEKKAFLLKHKIALWDVIAKCKINGSKDSSIEDVVVNDLNNVLKDTSINHIYLNGNTAFKLYNKYLLSKYEINITKLPSTSPANASFDINKLLDTWKIIRLRLEK